MSGGLAKKCGSVASTEAALTVLEVRGMLVGLQGNSCTSEEAEEDKQAVGEAAGRWDPGWRC